MATVVIRETFLGFWGNIGAIVAALVALWLAFIPALRRWTSRDLDGVLRIEDATLQLSPGGHGAVMVKVSLYLRNESDITIARKIPQFDIT
jgi:nitrate/nitrite transporter NarK